MESRTIEAVLFDLDGTLIEYEGLSHVALEAPIKRVNPGLELSWDLHGQIVGQRSHDWSRHILTELGVTQLAPDEYVRQYHEIVHASVHKLPLQPGASELVEKFRSLGFKMAIATSSERSSFDKKMANEPMRSIREAMHAVVTGDEVSRGKPHPEIFILAASRLGVEPQRCIVFEDSPHGVASGLAAGCLVAALPDARFPANKPRFADAHFVLGSLAEFDPTALLSSRFLGNDSVPSFEYLV